MLPGGPMEVGADVGVSVALLSVSVVSEGALASSVVAGSTRQ